MRCAYQTANILDLIMTNCSHVKSAGSSEVNLSDHQPTYLMRKKNKTVHESETFECRMYQSYVKEDFQSDLQNSDWRAFFETEDVDEAWLKLYNRMLTLANKHCPYQKFTRLKKLPP